MSHHRNQNHPAPAIVFVGGNAAANFIAQREMHRQNVHRYGTEMIVGDMITKSNWYGGRR